MIHLFPLFYLLGATAVYWLYVFGFAPFEWTILSLIFVFGAGLLNMASIGVDQ